MLHDLTRISGYRRARFVEDPKLEGQRIAEMNEGDDEIRVSPAMFELLKSDFESMSKNLQVRVLPPKRKRQNR